MNTEAFDKNNTEPNTVLFVDDDEFSRSIMAEIISDDYDVIFADNGRQGLELLERHRPEICAILLDLNMPVMDGKSMLKEINAIYGCVPLPVFILTDEQDRENIKMVCELGAVEVISKVARDNFMVRRRISYMIELFNSRNNFQQAVDKKTAELREQNKGMIEALATATEFRSGESGEHVRRIHDITYLFLAETSFGENYSKEEIDQIAYASILHDVGKISIPDAILNKPGRFTQEEFELMKQHTINGEKMLTQIPQLKNLPFYDHARTIARYHHERWDGRGYPDGLAGDDIPVGAQVVSIADVYDALVSQRVYKPPLTHDTAMEMILGGKCGIFNPQLLREFENVSEHIKNIYKHGIKNGHAGEEHGSHKEGGAD